MEKNKRRVVRTPDPAAGAAGNPVLTTAAAQGMGAPFERGEAKVSLL